MSNLYSVSQRARQRGAGMMETMVGVLIGLLVVLVVYNLLAVSENYRRTTTGASDAQITGLLTQFVAGRDAANGGNGISLSAPDLIGCVDLALRPIPVLVTDGGAAGVSDSFISLQSAAPHVLWPIEFRVDAPPNTDFIVQSPNGFNTPAGASMPTVAVPHRVIAVQENGTGCELIDVTSATVPDPITGNVTLVHSPSALAYSGAAIPPARLVSLGPVNQASRIQYDVDAANSQLRTRDVFPAPGGAAANPIAQNVVLMKVQYGIDTVGNGIVNCWTAAAAGGPCGDYSENTVRSFSVAQLNRILAVRIGVVIRSDEPDFKDPTLISTGPNKRADVVLFNCAANDLTCQSRIVVPAGVLPTPTSTTCGAAIICDQWRYRAYETVVPLRNTIYNSTLP